MEYYSKLNYDVFTNSNDICAMNKTTASRPRGRPRNTDNEAAQGTVQALDRGLVLLKALAKEGDSSVTDIALTVGLPTSTTHRILSTLQKHQFVDYDSKSQLWSIGLEAFRVGSTYLARTDLVETSRRLMHELTDSTGETANLAITEDGDVVFISQVETHNPIRAFFRPGTRGFMHASGIGKAILANMSKTDVEKILAKKGCPSFTDKTLSSPRNLFDDLERTKTRGWSLDDEETYTGMRCVAAPIFNLYGEAIAGVSVSGPAVRFSDQALTGIGEQVMQAANEITRIIGGKLPIPGTFMPTTKP